MLFKKTMMAVALASVGALSAPAMANDFAVGAVVGTGGMGIEATYALEKNINLRAGLRGFSKSYDFTEDNVDYTGDLKIRTGGITVDWYPFSGSTFHMSAGAWYNGNKITGKAKPTDSAQSYTINDVDYLIDGRVDAEIDWRKFAPYLGIGFGNPVGKNSNWSFTFDAGVMFTGSPRSTLGATGAYSTDNGATWTQVDLNDPANPFTQDLAAERVRLNDEIKDAKFWPVVQLGLHYKF